MRYKRNILAVLSGGTAERNNQQITETDNDLEEDKEEESELDEYMTNSGSVMFPTEEEF
jgi:hypothetical protein